MVAGIFGSLVANASCTFASPLSTVTDLIRPNETISRLNPGYRTDFSASRMSASLIVIERSYREQGWSKDTNRDGSHRTRAKAGALLAPCHFFGPTGARGNGCSKLASP